MSTIKTAISLEKTLFDQADSLAQEINVPRSHLFVLALEEFIQRHNNKIILEQINLVYQDEPSSEEKTYLKNMATKHRKIVQGQW